MAGFLQYHAALMSDEKIPYYTVNRIRTFDEFRELIRNCERRKAEEQKFSERAIVVAWNIFVCCNSFASSFDAVNASRYLSLDLNQNNRPLIAELRKLFMHFNKYIRIQNIPGGPSIRITHCSNSNDYFGSLSFGEAEQRLILNPTITMASQAQNASTRPRPTPVVIEIPRIFKNPLQGLNPEIIFALM